MPYRTLLRKRSSSSSMPVTPLKARPADASAHPKDAHMHRWGSAFGAARGSLQATALQGPKARGAQATEEEEWPDLSHLSWGGQATGVIRGQAGMTNGISQAADDSALQAGDTGLSNMLNGKTDPHKYMRLNSAPGMQGSSAAVSAFRKSNGLKERPRWGATNAQLAQSKGRAFFNAPSGQARSTVRPDAAVLGVSATDADIVDHTSSDLHLSQTSKPLMTHFSLTSLIGQSDKARPGLSSGQVPGQPNMSPDLSTDLRSQQQQSIDAQLFAAQQPAAGRQQRSNAQGLTKPDVDSANCQALRDLQTLTLDLLMSGRTSGP